MKEIGFLVKHSKFYAPLSTLVHNNLNGVLSGEKVSIDFETQAYEQPPIQAEITKNSFIADFSNFDPTRFSARLKALATVLRDEGLFGKYTISHQKGVVEFQMVTPSEIEAKSSMVELSDNQAVTRKPRYWWVNHKQTSKQELGGGYIWSPKTNRNGSFNNSYENMKKARFNDVVFSFSHGEIKAIGRVIKEHTTTEKPLEFGQVGEGWSKKGWHVGVEWEFLDRPFKPKENIDVIRPLLADKYAPIQNNGNGNQGCYLAEVSPDLADVLFDLSALDHGRSITESTEVEAIKTDDTLDDVTKLSLVESRTGQGRYKKNLMRVEDKCRFTGITTTEFLIASHIKPWIKSDRKEKLDGYNGLLLSPHVDKLFDGGWISISKDSQILCASSDVEAALRTWHIDPNMDLGAFSAEQQEYLDYHRTVLFEARKKKLHQV